MGLCSNLLQPLFKRAITVDDSPIQEKRKKILITIFSILVGVCSLMLPIYLTTALPLAIAAIAVYLFGSVGVMVWLVGLRRGATDGFLKAVCAVFVVGITTADVGNAVFGNPPSWPLFIIIIDILLTCEAPSGITIAVVAWCCIYLTFIYFESIFRFGFFDFEWQNYAQQYRRTICECEDLPCKRGFTKASGELVVKTTVFFFDFIFTRGFASAVLEERKLILASVDTTQHIAMALSRFDLEQSTSLLNDACIPEELRCALEQILKNLRSYKPYLPQSCLRGVDSSSSENTAVNNSMSTTESSRVSKASSLSTTRVFHRTFEPMNVSLIVANVSNSMSVLDHSRCCYVALIADLIGTVSDIITKNRGTFDLFLGDRLFANFGASRARIGHPASCAEAAKAIIGAGQLLLPYETYAKEEVLSMNVGMASGKLTCGDLGGTSVKRFSLIGKLSLIASLVERAGRSLNIPMLTESGLYTHIKHTMEARVYLQTMLYDGTTYLLYEVFSNSKGEPDEWMYELLHSGVGKWDAYNTAAVALLTNQPLQNPIPDFNNLRYLQTNGPPENLIITRR